MLGWLRDFAMVNSDFTSQMYPASVSRGDRFRNSLTAYNVVRSAPLPRFLCMTLTVELAPFPISLRRPIFEADTNSSSRGHTSTQKRCWILSTPNRGCSGSDEPEIGEWV